MTADRSDFPLTYTEREPSPAVPRGGARTPLAGLRILVLDSPADPTPLGAWLVDGGATVRCAGSPGDALELLDAWRADVVVADLTVPGESGFALIKRVRALSDYRAAIPAVALSRRPSTQDRIRAIAAGFSVYTGVPGSADDVAVLLGALARHGSEPRMSPRDFSPSREPEGAGAQRRIRTFDIVVPVYNEEQGAPEFHRELAGTVAGLAPEATIYYVDDGSTDGTARALEAIASTDSRVVIVELSRNFGHQAALSAGLDQARGDAVITMDGDGQHPPDVIPAMLELLESGYDVVLAQRTDQRQASVAKRWMSSAFYWLLGRLSATSIRPGCADFRAMSRPVVHAIRQMPERHRFVRGMIAWLGFRSAVVPYAERPRRAGASKYSLGRMLRLSSDAISSFSFLPLYVGLGLGMLFLLLAMLEAAYVLSFWASGTQHRLVRGWSSLMFAILIVGGFAMVSIGIIGSYVGYIFQEVKRRPIYVVRSVRGSRAGQSGEPG